ncbi:MAG: hypothetical protein FJ363_00990 [Gemmatimonadetes bacterium]|nr:hypothetical protein [Gemmatimonadota bacterium]
MRGRVLTLLVAGALLPERLYAQLVPGRDLLAFPIGLTAEAPALGTTSGFGLWNPASVSVPDGSRMRLAVGTMSAPVDVAVGAQVASVATRWRGGTTVALGIAHASVADLLRTDSDPQSIGDEIAYATTLVSVIAARPLGPVTAGAALRLRSGRLDQSFRRAVSVDVGVISRGLGSRDVRLAASTFLASPFSREHEQAELLLAADARLVGTDTLRTARAGLSYTAADGLPREAFGFVGGRWARLEARLGAARTEAYGRTNWRGRLGIAFHHRGYVIGVAREESAGNLSATYQFTLSSVLK